MTDPPRWQVWMLLRAFLSILLGNIYIADSMNYCIRKIDASTGVITTVAGFCGWPFSGWPPFLIFPTGVTVDSADNIYIADQYSNAVLKVIDASIGVMMTIAGGGGIYGYSGDNGPAVFADLAYPAGVSVDSAGNIYIADSENNCIRKVDVVDRSDHDGCRGWDARRRIRRR